MPALMLRGSHITLAQALKVSGQADSGGHGKYLIREGQVQVNGMPESRPGRKLVAGDRFVASGGEEWLIAGPA